MTTIMAVSKTFDPEVPAATPTTVAGSAQGVLTGEYSARAQVMLGLVATVMTRPHSSHFHTTCSSDLGRENRVDQVPRAAPEGRPFWTTVIRGGNGSPSQGA